MGRVGVITPTLFGFKVRAWKSRLGGGDSGGFFVRKRLYGGKSSARLREKSIIKSRAVLHECLRRKNAGGLLRSDKQGGGVKGDAKKSPKWEEKPPGNGGGLGKAR